MERPAQSYGAKLQARHVGFFETPAVVGKLQNGEALMNELERSIRRNKARRAGLSRSNIGSWHCTGKRERISIAMHIDARRNR